MADIDLDEKGESKPTLKKNKAKYFSDHDQGTVEVAIVIESDVNLFCSCHKGFVSNRMDYYFIMFEHRDGTTVTKVI